MKEKRKGWQRAAVVGSGVAGAIYGSQLMHKYPIRLGYGAGGILGALGAMSIADYILPKQEKIATVEKRMTTKTAGISEGPFNLAKGIISRTKSIEAATGYGKAALISRSQRQAQNISRGASERLGDLITTGWGDAKHSSQGISPNLKGALNPERNAGAKTISAATKVESNLNEVARMADNAFKTAAHIKRAVSGDPALFPMIGQTEKTLYTRSVKDIKDAALGAPYKPDLDIIQPEVLHGFLKEMKATAGALKINDPS